MIGIMCELEAVGRIFQFVFEVCQNGVLHKNTENQPVK